MITWCARECVCYSEKPHVLKEVILIWAGLWCHDALTVKICSPVVDTLLYLRGPGADLLVVVCFEYQTSSINLQRWTRL